MHTSDILSYDTNHVQTRISYTGSDRCRDLLYTQVQTGGMNFSHMQKKLIQIGRAILLKPSILLIDSSFFNVEEIYERLYYSLIFKNLPNTTIVCILDRYDMLDHFDRVILMDKGTVVETGRSLDLLDPGHQSLTMQLVNDRVTQDNQYWQDIIGKQ